MECKLKNRTEVIIKYLMGDLPEGETATFEEHYFQCKICFDELKTAEKAVNIIRQEGLSMLSEVSRKKTRGNLINKLFDLQVPQKWGIIFATAAIAFILFYVLYQSGDNFQTETIVANHEKDSLQQIGDEITPPEKEEMLIKKNDRKLIANLSGPAFQPNTYYEEWIKDNVRSENAMIKEILSPVIGDTLTNLSIKFKWVMNENIPVSIKLLNNSEKVIISLKATQKQYPDFSLTYYPDAAFESGLYYWRIEDENEVIYVGKFYYFN